MRRVLVERRWSRLASWARRVAQFAAVLLVVSAASHRFGLLATPPLLTLLAVVAALGALALLLALAGFVRIWASGDRGVGSAIWGGLLALVVLSPFAVSAVWGFSAPQLNDISTDLSDPPRFALAVHARPADSNRLSAIAPEAARMQEKAYPDLSPHRYEYPPDRVTEMVGALIADRGWQLLGKTEAASPGHPITIEAVASTLLLGFECDVAIRIWEQDEAVYVDMRSASRYGRGDLGDNAARIRSFLDDLDQRMEAHSRA